MSNAVQNVYNQFDTDHNKFLNKQEFTDLMHQNGNTNQAEIDATFQYYDHNNDGMISFEEFKAHIHGGQTVVQEQVQVSQAPVMRQSQTTYSQAPVMRQSQTTYAAAPVYRTSTYQTNVSAAPQGQINYNLKDLFDQYDQNRDGHLDVAELKNFYSGSGVHLSDHEVNLQLKYINPVAGNKVNYDEFQSFVRLRR